MASVNSLQIIDNLGEITKHRDRELIEKSLLKTLAELAPNQEFKLFKVLCQEGEEITLELSAHSLNDCVETSGFHVDQYELPTHIKQLILSVIECKKTAQLADNDNKPTHIIYPGLDQYNEVFAILVHVCGEGFEHGLSRFVFGLLKVYSNYLALLEDNQRDKLTQLLNRDTMDREISRILIMNAGTYLGSAAETPIKRRKDEPAYWLGVLDIDHFKAVNDNFGHLFGDDVLILVARKMQQVIRGEKDLLYRYGGEEFVIILQAANIDEAKNAFNRLRINIAQHDFPQVGTVTVSIGVVQITNQAGSSDIISQADQALYYVKEHGRNQICCYEDLLQHALIEQTKPHMSSKETEFF